MYTSVPYILLEIQWILDYYQFSTFCIFVKKLWIYYAKLQKMRKSKKLSLYVFDHISNTIWLTETRNKYRMSHQYWANFDRSNGVVRIGQFWWNLDIIYLNCTESLSSWFHTETFKIVNFFILANFLWSFLLRSKLMPFQILPLAVSSTIVYHLLPIGILEVQNFLPLAVFIENAHWWKVTTFLLLFSKCKLKFEYQMITGLSTVN